MRADHKRARTLELLLLALTWPSKTLNQAASRAKINAKPNHKRRKMDQT